MSGTMNSRSPSLSRREAVIDNIVAEAFKEQNALAEVRAVRAKRKAGVLAKLNVRRRLQERTFDGASEKPREMAAQLLHV